MDLVVFESVQCKQQIGKAAQHCLGYSLTPHVGRYETDNVCFGNKKCINDTRYGYRQKQIAYPLLPAYY